MSFTRADKGQSLAHPLPEMRSIGLEDRRSSLVAGASCRDLSLDAMATSSVREADCYGSRKATSPRERNIVSTYTSDVNLYCNYQSHRGPNSWDNS